MFPKEIFFGFLLLVCGYAWWRGRSEEKIAATTCLLAVLATRLLISPLPSRYADIEFGLLGIDLVVLAAFVAIALQSKRFWPLWAAGFQLTLSISHGLKAVDLDLLPRAYAAAAVFWSYPILLAILVGTWRTHRSRSDERVIAA
ncbi:MAG TPA: hypothetical protein VMK31_02945 [Sphingomicrobium sp.]|nr:hypothetical protein [Sphingomicrobium sp.]